MKPLLVLAFPLLSIACGPAAVEVDCDLNNSCEDGPAEAEPEAPALRCPESTPVAGDSCDRPGQPCFYLNDEALEACKVTALCTDEGWMVATPACVTEGEEEQNTGNALAADAGAGAANSEGYE